MTRSKDLEFTHIQTADHTKDNGWMVNSMEKEFLLLLWETKGKEFGMKEKELDGQMTT